MSPITEVEAIASLDDLFSQIQDPLVRDRVLKWAWDKFAAKPLPLSEVSNESGKSLRAKKKPRPARQQTKAKPKFSILRDLNLRPEGERTFKEFSEEKQPGTNQEKCTVAVYYLNRELVLNDVSISHIYTCYKEMNWRVPDLYNVLALTAHKKGWLNTSNMNAIALTTHGENLVEHDLPRQIKDKA